jgi:amino acid transporter
MSISIPPRLAVIISLVGLFWFSSVTVFAQTTNIPIDPVDVQGPGWTLVPEECLGDRAATDCGFEQLLQLAANIIGLLMAIALLLAALLFGYAGFLYATTAGDPGKAKRARGIFTSVAVGLIIVFLAYTIVQVVVSIFGVQDDYNLFLESSFNDGVTQDVFLG